MTPTTETSDRRGSAARGRDSLADTAVLAIGCAYALAIGVTPLYGALFDAPLPASPTFSLTVLFSVLVGVGLALTVGRERVEAIRAGPPSSGDSVWNEVSLFGYTYIFAAVCVGILLSFADSVGLVPATLGTVATHLGGAGLALTLLARRRQGRFAYPDWLEIESWNTWGYLALFGSVFVLTYVALTPAFGPAGRALPVVSLAYAVSAVALRSREAPSADRRR